MAIMAKGQVRAVSAIDMPAQRAFVHQIFALAARAKESGPALVRCQPTQRNLLTLWQRRIGPAPGLSDNPVLPALPLAAAAEAVHVKGQQLDRDVVEPLAEGRHHSVARARDLRHDRCLVASI